MQSTFSSSLLLSIVAVLASSVSACTGDTLDREEAQTAFLEVMTLSQQVEVAATSESGTSNVVHTVAGALPCPAGGNIDYGGSFDDADPSAFDLNLDYIGCATIGGVTIDGDLMYSGSWSSMLNFSFAMDGILSFSGNVSGSCTLDLSLSQSQGTYSAQGDLCGNTFVFP